MELVTNVSRRRGGFALPMVLVLTAVGLLFGAGSLLLFRYQCQLRIDRQHELEKVYAVRSALNWIRTNAGTVPMDGKEFKYYTGSGRNLNLIVKPSKCIFPNPATNHFNMETHRLGVDGLKSGDLGCQYGSLYDYEWGSIGATNNSQMVTTNNGTYTGLAVTDLDSTNSVRWWVNIGMRGTGGWLQEDYGRRYFFLPREYVDGASCKDTMRLCIIRNITNATSSVGCRHGWPLLRENERALVFEVCPRAGGIDAEGTDTNSAVMAFSEYYITGGKLFKSLRWRSDSSPSTCNMGLQLANNCVTLFYVSNASPNGKISPTETGGYTFLQSLELTADTYKYFRDTVTIGGIPYGGIYTNSADGRVYAPELRAVFEVEATSDRRKVESHDIDAGRQYDFLTKFRVTPAYQYDVFLEHPIGVWNLATVAQKLGEYQREVTDYRVLTYDTHGTEHKGFRRDEREWERSRGH